MRQGGVNASFTQQVDAAGGRVDMTLTRGADPVGASGTGLARGGALRRRRAGRGDADGQRHGRRARRRRRAACSLRPVTVTVR